MTEQSDEPSVDGLTLAALTKAERALWLLREHNHLHFGHDHSTVAEAQAAWILVRERLAALAGPLEQPQEPTSDRANLAQASGGEASKTARPASHDVTTCPYFGMYLDLSEASGYPHEKDTMVSPEEYGAALLKDAERYRWLRDKSEPGICAFYLSVGDAFKRVKFARATVDEAIDAQIAAQTNTEGAQP